MIRSMEVVSGPTKFGIVFGMSYIVTNVAQTYDNQSWEFPFFLFYLKTHKSFCNVTNAYKFKYDA